ncbi:MAG TPA: signal peptidase I [Candidatus Yonathbacteria bacterium]|nr:signal peptidase I [Candidatus Yonathbacteria bacterium]
MDTQKPDALTLEQEPENSTSGIVWEVIKFFVIASIIVIPIRIFIAQPFIVSGSSMDPTFADKQYLIVDQLSYNLGTPERGDVVILRYPLDTSVFFIKRVVGLPNETVTITDGVVSITSPENELGITLDEPYIKFPKFDSSTRTLGDKEYFVMGDNRAASLDSRAWGPAPENLIIGKVFLRLLPTSQASLNPGAYNQPQ